MLTLVGTVFVIVFMYLLVFSAIRWIFKTILETPAVSETPSLNRLFGLVAVAIFFGGLVANLYDVVRGQIVILFSEFPTRLAAAFREGMACIESDIGFRSEFVDSLCVSTFFFDASRTIREIALGFFGGNGFGRIDPATALGAMAIFLIVTIITSRVRSDLEKKEQFWIAYGCVAFFATYLTLSAILAVPLLTEDANDGAPRPAAQLKTSLEEMIPKDLDTATVVVSSEMSMADVFADDKFKNPALRDTEKQLNVKARLSDFRKVANTIEARLNGVRAEEAQVRSVVTQSLTNQMNAAVLSYESEIDVRKGQREANRHFVDLRSWFQFVIDETNYVLNECSSAVESAEQRYAQANEGITRLISNGHDGSRTDAARLFDDLQRRLDEERNVIGNAISDAEFRCTTVSNNSFNPPSRSDYGSFLGVVGTSASWLLSTESMEVALLTGLIGFGLLGSLVAQFVKTGGTEEFDMAQIATVVFTGFCAAIVVYVTAYGGLAITSMSGNDPNPYVVFAACLVGAVYSETIWARAKAWMVQD